MKVLLLGAYPPPYGGVQTHIVGLRAFLMRRAIPCDVINLTRYRAKRGNGIFYPRSAIGVLWLLLRLRYDIAHLHVGGNLTLRWLLLGLVCSWIPKKKVILTFHSGGYPSSPEGRAAVGPKSFDFKGMTLRRLHGLIGVNQELVVFFRRLGVPAENIRLISPYAPGTELAAELPAPLRKFFTSHRPVIVSVSGLEPEYDLSMQIRVLGDLRRNLPDAGLAVIGSGSQESKLREEIAKQPYRDHILLCGDLPHAATLRAIADADILLRTTLYDGDSISVREALHLGVPVVATENGMRPEGVVVIPRSSSIALIRAVEACLRQENRPRRPLASDEHNLEAVLEFYRSLVQSESSGPARKGREDDGALVNPATVRRQN